MMLLVLAPAEESQQSSAPVAGMLQELHLFAVPLVKTWKPERQTARLAFRRCSSVVAQELLEALAHSYSLVKAVDLKS